MAQVQIPDFVGQNEERARGYQNAMLNKSRLKSAGIEQGEQQRAISKRNELEQLMLRTPEPDRDRAAFEWSKVNDMNLHGKLQALQLEKLQQGMAVNPEQAASAFERATGEKLQYDPQQGVHIIDMQDGSKLAIGRGGRMEHFKSDTPKPMLVGPGTSAIMPGQTEPFYTAPFAPKADKDSPINNPFQLWQRQNPSGTYQDWLALQPKDEAAGPKKYGSMQLVQIVDPETGQPAQYWADTVQQTLKKAIPGGRSPVPEIPASTQAIIQATEITLPVLDELQKDLSTISTGPLWGRLGSLSMSQLGGAGVPPEAVAIRSKLGRLTADQIFGEGGKQLTGTEKQMIEPYVLNQNDTLQSAMAKLPELRKRTLRIRESRMKMMNPRTRAAHPDLQSPGGAAPANPQADSLRQKYNY